MIKALIQHSPYCTEIRFPCSEAELSKKLGELGMNPEHLAPMATVIEIEPSELSVLEDCNVSLDALNYLGKRLDGIYGELTVPEENISEFKALYAEALREKYYHAASEVGGIVLVWDEGRHNTSYYPIAEDYTRTINYLKSLYDNSDFYNDNMMLYNKT